jgi:murein DD-endopeptidase MepM/ murein hydrolase activator NlpD
MSGKSPLQKIAYWMILVLLLAGLLAGCKVAPETGADGTTPQLPQPKTISDPEWIELQQAIQAAAEGREDVLAFLLYRISIDDVKFNDDHSLAVVWISLVDPANGTVQSAEPGLVIAHKMGEGQWSVVFQADPSFATELLALPSIMMSDEDKAMYMPGIQQESKDGTVYRGYHLPWAAGLTKNLTGSIGHVYTYKSCPSTCRYAYDFADGTMFAVTAAKAGTVKYAVWKYANGNTTNANYIVLEDTTTTPTTYQVYSHLAQNSIPTALRTVGARVTQGQFLGYADDTGYSTGNHLHFMVHANSTSYWGTSVDIRFDEVSINDGTPRLCSEATAYPEYGKGCATKYTSRNGDSALPTGKINSPAAYTTVTTSILNVAGTLSDDTAVASGQLMINTGSAWAAIGPVLTSTSFSTDIDLCSAKVPDGTFFLSLVVTDKAGKTSLDNTALTELTKSYACPADPPVCTPGENQVALTSEINYQGSCQLLDIGKYANLSDLDAIKADQTSSVQLGSGVSLLLYPETDFGGTLNFFQVSDANLSDNPIGLLNAASARVVARIDLPAVPEITIPDPVTAEDDIQFSWTTVEGVDYQASLSGQNDYSSTTDWMQTGLWHIGTLPTGDYTLTISANNLAGTVQASREFTVVEPIPAPVAALNQLPQVTNSTAINLTWEVSSGADNIDHFEFRYRLYGEPEWKDWEARPGTDTRAAVFYGVFGSTYEFQIRAVAANGKALEFPDAAETRTYVTNSCIADTYEGSDPGDDEQTAPALLTISEEQTHNWCEQGDVDWLTFAAEAGQELVFTASPTGTSAAAVMYLYDSDSVTLLGEYHPLDDASDAVITWTVPADGMYYLRLEPRESEVYGTDAAYTVGFIAASTAKPGSVICGSVTIPAILGGVFYTAKKVKEKKQKAAKRPGWR